MNNKNDIWKYFNNRFPQGDVNSGIIKEIKKEIKKIEKTTDLEEKHREVFSSLKKHNAEYETLLGYFNLYIREYGINREVTIGEYKKQIDKLEKLWSETSDEFFDKFNKKPKNHQPQFSYCSYCQSKPPTNHYIYSEKDKILKPRKRNAIPYKKEHLFCSESHFEKWHEKNYYYCSECVEEKYDGKYFYHKSKNDQQKFCSNHCFLQHYAETCDNCLEKCLKYSGKKAIGQADTYYSDPKNKTGTLCSKCHQEQLKELAEEERKNKEWEESFRKIDKGVDDLVKGMEDAVRENNKDKDNSEDNSKADKSNQIKSNQIKSNQIKSNQIWTISPPTPSLQSN